MPDLMIRAVVPQLQLSGNIDKIFDEVTNPTFRHQFVVSLSLEQIKDLLGWIVESGALARESEAIEAGKSRVPAQLMIEFKCAVERMLA